MSQPPTESWSVSELSVRYRSAGYVSLNSQGGDGSLGTFRRTSRSRGRSAGVKNSNRSRTSATYRPIPFSIESVTSTYPWRLRN